MRKIITSLLLIFFSSLLVYSQVGTSNKVTKAVNILKADIELKNASFGFLAVDTKTGETIAQHNPDMSLMPASTLKLVSTATALEVLGTNYTFITKLEYSGTIDTTTSTLHGNIYITGGSDPSLGSKYFDKEKKYLFIDKWINTLKDNKIQKINGAIIADASRYGTETAPPKWSWEDVGNYYGAGPNGLTVFDNCYEIYFKSPNLPDKLTSIIRTEPKIPGLQIINKVQSSNARSDQAFVFAAPYSFTHILRGTIPKARNEFKIKGCMPDPALFLAQHLESKLEENGINCTEGATTIRLLDLSKKAPTEKRKTLHAIYSPSLINIIDLTNMKSINLFAEHLLNEIGYKLTKEGSNRAGRHAVTQFWSSKGMDTEGLHIHDGCGLSRSDAITARQMVFLLRYMKKSKNYKAFYNSLPVAGKSGTLRRIGRKTSAEGNVHAKSGSIGLVRAYAGYVTTKSGRELAFSMNIANYNCSSSKARKKLTSLMIAMASMTK